ncbi:MAG: 30S ribosome-binding factor RbfA [Clostridiales bacterium]
MAKFRNNRINGELQREISDILQNEIKDPGLGFVSIVHCEVSGDLRVAKVYYSVLGDEETVESSQEVMKKSAGFIRHEIATRLSIRYAPELVFVYDDSIQHGIKISQILQEEKAKQVKKDEEE